MEFLVFINAEKIKITVHLGFILLILTVSKVKPGQLFSSPSFDVVVDLVVLLSLFSGVEFNKSKLFPLIKKLLMSYAYFILVMGSHLVGFADSPDFQNIE